MLKKIFIFTFFPFLAVGALFALTIFYFSLNLPSVDRIETRRIVQSTKIFDRTGKILLYEISGGERRTVVPFEEIPQFIKDATIAIEDENFYEGPGVDWRGILRAVFVNILRGRIVQGGSTITQQLAKNAFLSSEQTFVRKIKELILAIQLTRRYTKDQILGFYLNEIPYGSTAYGIESASETYFGKPAKELNLPEGALLAALPRATTYYSPWGSHVKELMARQQHILQKLYAMGKIDKEQLDSALEVKLVFAPQGQGIKAPHFVIAVQDYLVQKYGEEMVRTGGLKVVTTLDSKLQTIAEKAVAEGAAQNEKLYKGKNASLVAEDPKTGQILAMVGSRDYFDTENEGNFNVATQGLRQPGSALKPFVYLTAMTKGYTPDTVVFDVPTEFAANRPNCPLVVDFKNEDPQCYHPENFDVQFRGPVNLRKALAQSVNIPAVKMLYLAGMKDVLKVVHDLGITTLNDASRYGLSLVLGGGEVKLADLVGAYSSLAQDGVRHEQTMILEVRDAKNTALESYKDASEQVVDSQSVRLINDILSDVSVRSGLFQGSLSLTTYPNHDVALKTGTSNDYRDAWAVGYIPSLVVGVWAGNNDNTPMQRQGSSILAAIPIWHTFLAEALVDYPTETFPRPDPVAASKPILRGDYLSGGEVHSILYYVNRNDPQGASPEHPEDDPQFVNWETGVLAWVRTNMPNLQQATSTASSVVPLGAPPQIRIQTPGSGTTLGNQVQLTATIAGANILSKVRVLFNGKLLQEFTGISDITYELNWSFTPQGAGLQNALQVEAIDSNNQSGKAEIVLYKK